MYLQDTQAEEEGEVEEEEEEEVVVEEEEIVWLRRLTVCIQKGC